MVIWQQFPSAHHKRARPGPVQVGSGCWMLFEEEGKANLYLGDCNFVSGKGKKRLKKLFFSECFVVFLLFVLSF